MFHVDMDGTAANTRMQRGHGQIAVAVTQLCHSEGNIPELAYSGHGNRILS